MACNRFPMVCKRFPMACKRFPMACRRFPMVCNRFPMACKRLSLVRVHRRRRGELRGGRRVLRQLGVEADVLFDEVAGVVDGELLHQELELLLDGLEEDRKSV